MSKFKTILAVTGIAVAVGAILFGVFAAAYGVQWVTAPFRGQLSAREQIQASGTFRIQAYDQFFSKCASAQTLQDQIANTREALEYTEGREAAQARTALRGLNNRLNDVVNGYNADSAREYTVGQFKDSDLPYRLNAQEEIECSNVY